ncbi:hypothetical protein FACS1894147_11160 [Spirochaetia bacterium]|nr:hypothetical protein FACS1894147_11160 [Spirochaetia bacterium]
MDERKKTIRELETQLQENQNSANLMLTDLGRQLLSRHDGSAEPLPGALAEYQPEYSRLLREIADAEDAIRQIEADAARLRGLDEDIQQKEQLNSSQNKEISAAYVKLGEILLEYPVFDAFTAPYKRQAEALSAKIRSLEERYESFEDKNGANVFVWISKSAQSMVIRSFLAKTQDNLRRLEGSLGEKFFLARPPEAADQRDVETLIGEIEDKHTALTKLSEELELIREERRKISDRFGAEGSPAKQKQAQEKQIRLVEDTLRDHCLAFGVKAASPANKKEFSPLFQAEDRAALDKIAEIQESIAGYRRQIEEIRISLTIDEERESIEKKKKVIDEHRQRIAAGEKAIGDLENQIDESNRHIEELESLLERIAEDHGKNREEYEKTGGGESGSEKTRRKKSG